MRKKEILTIRELTEITGIDYTSLRTYLDGYRFSKFREIGEGKARSYMVAYKSSKDFWLTLINFLSKLRKKYPLNNIYNYIDSKGIKI